MPTQKEKNLFVRRQRIMLERYELDVCTHCPKVIKYALYSDIVEGLPYCACDFCAELNEIDSNKPTAYFYANYDLDEDNNLCPCHNYPPEEAVKRAWAAVLKWEKENK